MSKDQPQKTVSIQRTINQETDYRGTIEVQGIHLQAGIVVGGKSKDQVKSNLLLEITQAKKELTSLEAVVKAQ